MNILYLVTGASEMISMQVKFSIETMLAQLQKGDRVYVVTDCPAVYQNFEDIHLIPVSAEKIAEWKGPHNFFWRSKIMALRMIADMHPEEHLMYLDGDTFLYGTLQEIKGKLDDGYGLMHKNEGCPRDMKERSLKMWTQTNGHTYSEVTISEKHDMWNAGVVAIPSQSLSNVLDTALEICDGMLDEDVEPIVIEQYSLSIALFEKSLKLISAEDVIGHYWHNKYEWCLYISKFFAYSYVKKRSHREEVEYLRHKSLAAVDRVLNVRRVMNKLCGKGVKG